MAALKYKVNTHIATKFFINLKHEETKQTRVNSGQLGGKKQNVTASNQPIN